MTMSSADDAPRLAISAMADRVAGRHDVEERGLPILLGLAVMAPIVFGLSYHGRRLKEAVIAALNAELDTA
jgi:hypothetical protein